MVTSWKLFTNTETAWHWFSVDSDTGSVPIGESVVIFNNFKSLLPPTISNKNVLLDFERRELLTNILVKKILYGDRKIILNTFLNKNSKVVEFIEKSIYKKFYIKYNMVLFFNVKKNVVRFDETKSEKIVIINKRVK